MVWARGQVGTEECPRSYVTAASMELLEKYSAWRTFGPAEVSGREAEAFAILEREWRMERIDGER